jgi:glycosyltransferase involved in cell wall biosynthesis
VRIGIEIGWGNRTGGARMVARQLVSAMAQLEPDWQFIVLSNTEQTGLECANIEQHVLPVPHESLYDIYNHIVFPHIQVPLFFRRKDVCLVHYTNSIISVWRPFRTVLHLHDLSPFRSPSSWTFLLRLYMKFHMRALDPKADEIITGSENSAADIREILGVPESRIRVVPYGLSDEFRVIDNRERLGEVRRRLNLPRRFILFVGTLQPRKNLSRLLEAYSRLEKKLFSLVVVGRRGWGKVNVARMARELKIEEHLTYIESALQSDMPCIYNMADLFVYPSLYEGFGYPPLEAMACGVPVVASRRSSIPEVVGDAALLIDPEDVNDIAGAMMKVLTDGEVRRGLIMKGHERIKRFSLERSARETLDIYKEVCDV